MPRRWVWIAALSVLAAEARAQPTAAQKDAAMRELQRPGGVGGCVFAAVPADVRREAVIAALSGPSRTSETFIAAVALASAGCAGPVDPNQDLAFVGAVHSAFRRAAASLEFAQRQGVGQRRLDAAWTQATAAEKAPFYALAEEFLDPKRTVTEAPIDVAAMAKRSAVEPSPRTEVLLRMYFISTALSERAEARLAERAR